MGTWRDQNGDILVSGTVYHEVAPQLVLMGFLQRLVNGGGHVDREYGAGRGRMDLLVRWPHPASGGRQALQLDGSIGSAATPAHCCSSTAGPPPRPFPSTPGSGMPSAPSGQQVAVLRD